MKITTSGQAGNGARRRLIPDSLHFCLYLTVALIGVATWRHDRRNHPQDEGAWRRAADLYESLRLVMEKGWFRGFGNEKLLAFSFQMCLILLTGGALARLPVLRRVLGRIAERAFGPRGAAWIVSTIAVATGLLHWGFSLIVSSVLVSEIARARARRRAENPGMDEGRLNLSLMAAAGYMGMLVWHGGLSGSVPLLANESRGLAFASPETDLPGEKGETWRQTLRGLPHGSGPGEIPPGWEDHFLDPNNQKDYLRLDISRTIGSVANLASAAAMLVLIPLGFVGLACLYGSRRGQDPPAETLSLYPIADGPRLRESIAIQIVTVLFSLCGLGLAVSLIADRAWMRPGGGFEIVILVSLCLGLLVSRRPLAYQREFQTTARDIAPILLQFPFYWGIYGILAIDQLALVRELADLLLRGMAGGMEVVPGLGQVLDPGRRFLLSTYLSSCVVHMAVPSGGGQWMIQGPVSFMTILQSNPMIPVDPARVALAVAYGNQTANLIQPFWILPVVSFTGADPKRVLFYAAHCLIIAVPVYVGCLLFL